MIYLLKLLFFVLFSTIVIRSYYFEFNFHIENFDGYTPYVIIIIIIYFLYKGLNYITGKKQISFTPMKIFWFFLLQLFILSILTLILLGGDGGLGFVLFFKILSYLFFPTIFVFSFISFGKFLLKKISGFEKESDIFQFLTSIGLGFFVFITSITIIGFLGFYNLYVVFSVLLTMIFLSYKEFIELISSLFNYKIEITDHDYNNEGEDIFGVINPYLLTSEFLFIVISFLISVNFINIVRPMPIGWDDLGVYMNLPNLLAYNLSIIDLGGMFSWQIFTGIGYMLSGATQAFFINNIGGVLSLFVIILSLKDLLQNTKKTFINIPLLIGAIFLAMPMVIFQQAKDMKLDPGLFFVSIIVLYMTFYIFLKYLGYTKDDENLNVNNDKESSGSKVETKINFISYFKNFDNIGEDIFSSKTYLIYLIIIGLLAGLAFSIKITTLLLISGIIGIFFYSKLGLSGFIGYLSIYIAIFTGGGLWAMMNVVYPKDDKTFVNNVFMGGIILGVSLLFYSINKYKVEAFKKLLIILSLFLIGIIAGLSPWIIKNIYSTGKISISSILSGKVDTFNIDYKKIYSESELKQINDKHSTENMTTSGVSTNEDLGRYFGYDKGVNNYLKLPYNLTMQSNQRGEYTDITYIFLALIPVILFLSFKTELLSIGIFLFISIFFSFFFLSKINSYFTNIFTGINLPFGYAIILLVFLLPFLYLIYSLKKDKYSVLFKLNIVFGIFYIFLWTISAFGIVWYGISMYYSVLFAYSIGIYYISNYNDNDEFKIKTFKLFGSIITFLSIGIYFFYSTFPHGFNNLKESSYVSFKAGMTDNYTAIFEAHMDYYNILVELNIKKSEEIKFLNYIISSSKNEDIKKVLKDNNINDLIALNQAFGEISNFDNKDGNLKLSLMKQEAKILRSRLYKNVLYPPKEFKNNLGIYRIGTFLKYFISDNNNRLFEDSLIFEFNKYFYDEKDLNIGIERMKKMGVNYFLVDLNAATIDRDPAHNLTTRYENLLKTFTGDNLELIHTDSTCLKIALEDYKKSNKTQEDLVNYLKFAGVNYESYTNSGETINRGTKQIECYNKILNLMKDGKVSDENYKYLVPIVKYINENKIDTEEQLVNFFRSSVSHGWLVLFRIK